MHVLSPNNLYKLNSCNRCFGSHTHAEHDCESGVCQIEHKHTKDNNPNKKALHDLLHNDQVSGHGESGHKFVDNLMNNIQANPENIKKIKDALEITKNKKLEELKNYKFNDITQDLFLKHFIELRSNQAQINKKTRAPMIIVMMGALAVGVIALFTGNKEQKPELRNI